ncbi:MAG TPA: mechanosensitive ion channel domain-containing protein [Thermoleophilaceae bacterium]|nr:mechanosensitive ion channel domain-containing protein [Thermoleophilaceae bacterium]
MSRSDLAIAASFWDRHGDEVTAGATVVLAIAVAKLVDGALARRERTLSEAVARGSLSPVADTRLRLLRRLVFVAIVVLGIGLALAQFPAVKRVATGVLASSAVVGLVVGFAARQSLANAIAGILLAITQPIRVGDLVTFEDQTGEVEDVRLTYTYILLDDGRRLVVPNERLAQSSVQNHTLAERRVRVEASVWLPAGADVDRALELIATDDGVEASVAEVTTDGVRLVATTWADHPRERGRVAARLRARWLRRLREEGLSSEVAS